MIDRQGNRILIECDSCAEVFEGREGEDFKATWAAAREEGWKARQIGSDWVHGCARCGT